MRFTTVLWARSLSVGVVISVALACLPIAAQQTDPLDEADSSSTSVTSESEATSAAVEPVVSQPDQSVLKLFDGSLKRAPADIRDSEEPVVETTTQAATEEEPLKPIADSGSTVPAKVEAASLNGVTPGVTTMDEVEEAWGAAKEIKLDGSLVMGLYSVGPFEQVEVSYSHDKVSSIIVRFNNAFPAATLAKQLEMSDVTPVLVSSELGEILGQAYPERGVLFAFAPRQSEEDSSSRVAEIILEPISPEPFVLRAETNLDTDYASSLRDLQQALTLNPKIARAQWLQGRVLAAMGEFDQAIEAIDQAVRLDEENPEYRVTRAKILGQIGRMDEAIKDAEKAVELGQRRPHIRARALCLLGDLTASGPQPDYKSAIKYHTQAIQAADPLATNRHPAIRVVAKEVMVDAHLGAAHDIAWGNWKEKSAAVTRWLTQANAFAEDLIENEHGSAEYRFRVSTRALAACVGVQGKMDPEKWIREAIRSGDQLIAASEDAHYKARFQWDLGMALYDALQIYQMRDDHDMALTYGERAIEYLEEGEQYKKSAVSTYLLGRFYFRLGAIHAIRDQNHRVAISWFDKAIPLLIKPVPEEAIDDRGRHGETFVSMAVSYWESGQQERAVKLTEHGAREMKKAIDEGILEPSALAVPYNNLSAMHGLLGEDDQATEFQEMAERIKRTKLR